VQTMTLQSSAIINGGSIEDTGSGIIFQSGTLGGVSYDGTLNLAASYAAVYVAGGLTATTNSGAAAGAIDLAGYDSIVYFDDTQTFDNATITLSNNYASIYQYTTYAAYQANGYSYPTETLTFGAKLIVDQTTGSSGEIGSNGYGTGTIINNGTIDAAASGGSLTISPTSFVNNNAINVTNGDTLYISPTNFTNTGTIEVDSGSTVNLQTATTGTGTLNIGVSGTLVLSAIAASTQAIDFLGSTGSLVMNNVADFAGTITGFTGSDTIDFKNISFQNASQAIYSGGQLTVSDGTNTAVITLAGNYSGSTFVTSNDGSGGTLVVDPLLAHVA
jgi:2-keto-3-deoxy-6-phosphogluconate aldolase